MDTNLLFIILTATLAVLLVFGFHIAFAMSLTGILGIYLGFGGNLDPLRTVLWETINSSTLMVLVVFVLMGEFLLEGGISTQLYDAADIWFHKVPGGLLHTNIIATAIFSAASGSSMACAATFGKVAYTEGQKRGYDLRLNLGSLAAGACLDALIPPSTLLIFYGILTDQSIGKLYMAGIIPGICMALLFMLYIFVYSLMNPHIMPREQITYTWKERFLALRNITPMLILIVICLGPIYLGLATPNEAGAIGAIGALILGIAYRSLTQGKVWQALLRTVRLNGMLIFLMFGARLLIYMFANKGITVQVVDWVTGLGLPFYAIFSFICLLYIVLGCFFDSFSILFLTIPIIYPISSTLGIDPILFGIVVTMLLETGLITPPFGIVLFVIEGVTGGGHLGDIIRGIVPFFFLILIGIVMVMVFPSLALWLPSQM